MKEHTRWVGLDVHAETIVVAVAEKGGEVRSVGTIANRPEAVRAFARKLGDPERLRACYEAGPTGFVLYWLLTSLGVRCEVVAPTLVPVKAGDRVKTDRRDAEKLARLHRSGELTAVWVPDGQHEALRDLVRAREAAKRDQLRARHRLQKFLLRRGQRAPAGVRPWTLKHLAWVKGQVRFEHAAQEAALVDYVAEVDHAAARIQRLERAIDEAARQAPDKMRALIEGLQALRGVARLTAVTLVSELGEFSRFQHPRQLMGYSGLVPSENSSGQRTRRGGITKTGNAHLRRVLTEAAWTYRGRPSIGAELRRRQVGQSEEVKEIAWKAQHRLHSTYRRLLGKGKPSQKVVTAVSRELAGFIWAIGIEVEKQPARATATSAPAA
jgi:transposase